jgi:hypothetical protein
LAGRTGRGSSGSLPPGTGDPGEARAFPECGQEWRGLLNRACLPIEAALTEGETFHAQQIKEKYGMLRFYWVGDKLSEAKGHTHEFEYTMIGYRRVVSNAKGYRSRN